MCSTQLNTDVFKPDLDIGIDKSKQEPINYILSSDSDLVANETTKQRVIQAITKQKMEVHSVLDPKVRSNKESIFTQIKRSILEKC